jgi:hypothetical protein
MRGPEVYRMLGLANATHLFNVAGDKHYIDTARSQLVEDQEGVDHVAETHVFL